MFRATLKNLLSHKIRLALTALSVVLGVAFVAGTFIYTDTLNRSFDKLFAASNFPSVTVSKDTDISSPDGAEIITKLPASTVDTVSRLPGVDRAEGSVFVDGLSLIGPDGKRVTSGFAPTFGLSWADPNRLPAGTSLVAGNPPRGPGDVAIDESTADRAGLEVGDAVVVNTPGPRVEAKVSGIFALSSGVGATFIAFDLPTAQEVLLGDATHSVVTSVEVYAEPGVPNEELRDRVAAALPELNAETAAEASKSAESSVAGFLGFIRTALLVFAGISLFVGIFIILNTFSMLVAQRSRELALLRSVGASRRQILTSMLTEAFVVAIVGSTIGILAGFGLAWLVKSMLGLFGVDFGITGFVFQPRTAIVGYVVGILVTLIAALFPAIRATRIPPMAALRDDVAMPEHSLRLRVLIGSVLTTIGLVTLGLGLFASSGILFIGFGVALTFIGVIVLSPLISRTAVRLLGSPFRSTIGKLARHNAMRNPRRTSATAAALMIGLALIATIAVLASSMRASVDKAVDESLGADFQVADTTAAGLPFSQEVGNRLENAAGVAAVYRHAVRPAKVGDSDAQLVGIDPAAFGTAVKVRVVEGALTDFADDGMVISENRAEDSNLAVGDTQPVQLAGGARDFRVVAIIEEAILVGDRVIALDQLKQLSGDNRDNFVYVMAQPDANGQAEQAVDTALEPYPNLAAKTASQTKKQYQASITPLIGMIYGLLAMSIIIAAIGVINTLALSVYERTREIGLLRAIGLGRKQLKRMIRVESVIIAVFGAVLGLVLGTGFGVAMQRALADLGVDTLRMPIGQFALALGLAVVIGVLAALWPARRAAKLDVMKAITTE